MSMFCSTDRLKKDSKPWEVEGLRRLPRSSLRKNSGGLLGSASAGLFNPALFFAISDSSLCSRLWTTILSIQEFFTRAFRCFQSCRGFSISMIMTLSIWICLLIRSLERSSCVSSPRFFSSLSASSSLIRELNQYFEPVLSLARI